MLNAQLKDAEVHLAKQAEVLEMAVAERAEARLEAEHHDQHSRDLQGLLDDAAAHETAALAEEARLKGTIAVMRGKLSGQLVELQGRLAEAEGENYK